VNVPLASLPCLTGLCSPDDCQACTSTTLSLARSAFQTASAGSSPTSASTRTHESCSPWPYSSSLGSVALSQSTTTQPSSTPTRRAPWVSGLRLRTLRRQTAASCVPVCVSCAPLPRSVCVELNFCSPFTLVVLNTVLPTRLAEPASSHALRPPPSWRHRLHHRARARSRQSGRGGRWV
jgi:hypothetical protein